MSRGVWVLGDMGVCGPAPLGAMVLAFGDSRRGQLGVEPGAAARGGRSTFVTVEELRGCDPVQVEAAGVASFVVGARGQVWTFGSNRSMELGMRKEVIQVNAPQRAKSLRACAAVQLAGSSALSGEAHTLVLGAKGEVYTFGTSSSGALGQGPDATQTAPLVMRMSKHIRVKLVAAGAHHSFILTDAGILHSVGDNRHGQLGVARRDVKSVFEPQPVEGDLSGRKVLLIACGDDHALASADDGKLYAWGANANGQLGLGRLQDQCAPQPIRDLQDVGVTSLACGSRHSLVVARRGAQVWAFGSNVSGQLGVGQGGTADGASLSSPALTSVISGQRALEVTQVVAAASHSLAVTRAGEVFSFGDNTYGQLGFPPAGGFAAQGSGAEAVELNAGPALPSQGGLGRGGAASAVRRMEIDVPVSFMNGVAKLWVPTRIIGLALYKVCAASTADSHTLALAV